MQRREVLRQATALLGGTVAANLATSDAQEAGPDARLFPGFKVSEVQTTGATIHVVSGGQGPPVLLLHGAPQSHATWHKVVPELARDYRYRRRSAGIWRQQQARRRKESRQLFEALHGARHVEVMDHFGFQKFAVVGTTAEDGWRIAWPSITPIRLQNSPFSISSRPITVS